MKTVNVVEVRRRKDGALIALQSPGDALATASKFAELGVASEYEFRPVTRPATLLEVIQAMREENERLRRGC